MESHILYTYWKRYNHRVRDELLHKFPRAYQVGSKSYSTISRPRERLRAIREKKRIYAAQSDVIDSHFRSWAKDDFQRTRAGFEIAFERLGGAPAQIIETGTSAWGIDSTRLFDSYVRSFGGNLVSVDIRPEPMRRLRKEMSFNTQLVVNDSVRFLEGLALTGNKIDLFYLDSWDLDWADPTPSAKHGLAEWNALQKLARTGTMVLIDDTPLDLDWVPQRNREWLPQAQLSLQRNGFLPGKGALVLQQLKSRSDVTILWHGYNLLVQFD